MRNSESLQFGYVDERQDFFRLLEAKLGSVRLFPLQDDGRNNEENDGIIVCLPGRDSPDLEHQLSVLRKYVTNATELPVVAFLPSADRSLVRDCMLAGAYDCFVETGSMDELRIILRRAARHHELIQEVRRLRAAAVPMNCFESILAADPKMRAACSLAAKVASTDATVLITGESGTGKEVLARALHDASSRADQPFVAVACSSLPETLIEAELFGHEKGAFTGAVSARMGRFEAAHRGTILLDEIGDLPLSLQIKLLRVLQERTFERLGSNQIRRMEARVICATHQPLKQLTQSGVFRLDLYYRISTVQISLPALRERPKDILLLAQYFLRRYAERHHRPVQRISPAAMTALQEYDWPGNVRELQNVMERAVLMCDGSDIRVEHLPEEFIGWSAGSDTSSFEEEVREFKRRLIERTLQETGNNKVQAARTLRIPRSSLHRLIADLEITPDKLS